MKGNDCSNQRLFGGLQIWRGRRRGIEKRPRLCTGQEAHRGGGGRGPGPPKGPEGASQPGRAQGRWARPGCKWKAPRPARCRRWGSWAGRRKDRAREAGQGCGEARRQPRHEWASSWHLEGEGSRGRGDREEKAWGTRWSPWRMSTFRPGPGAHFFFLGMPSYAPVTEAWKNSSPRVGFPAPHRQLEEAKLGLLVASGGPQAAGAPPIHMHPKGTRSALVMHLCTGAASPVAGGAGTLGLSTRSPEASTTPQETNQPPPAWFLSAHLFSAVVSFRRGTEGASLGLPLAESAGRVRRRESQTGPFPSPPGEEFVQHSGPPVAQGLTFFLCSLSMRPSL